jgi:hypothetical protein
MHAHVCACGYVRVVVALSIYLPLLPPFLYYPGQKPALFCFSPSSVCCVQRVCGLGYVWPGLVFLCLAARSRPAAHPPTAATGHICHWEQLEAKFELNGQSALTRCTKTGHFSPPLGEKKSDSDVD